MFSNNSKVTSTWITGNILIFLYQGLSQYLLLNFWVEKSLNSFLDREKKYVGYYLLSYSILVIASVIEGLIG